MIKSISFFGTVTSGDAAAVACLNVITRMKGRILIKTIFPPTPSSLPLIQIMSWGLRGIFSVVGFFLIYFFLLRNISNHQSIAYYAMNLSSSCSHPAGSRLTAQGCAEWENDTDVVSNGGLALSRRIKHKRPCFKSKWCKYGHWHIHGAWNPL